MVTWRGGTDSVMIPESANLTELFAVVHFEMPTCLGLDMYTGHVLMHTVIYAACLTWAKCMHHTLA